jgi:hypothetical protein
MDLKLNIPNSLFVDKLSKLKVESFNPITIMNLCQVNSQVLSLIAKFIIHERSMNNVSRYFRTSWQDALRICHGIKWGTSKLSVDLHYHPERRIRYSAPQAMWDQIHILQDLYGTDYVRNTLMPIVLARPEEDQVWDIESMDGLSMFVYKYIPIRYLNTLLMNLDTLLMNLDSYTDILFILNLRPEVRVGKFELSYFGRLYNEMFDIIRTNEPKKIITALQILKKYGMPYLIDEGDIMYIAGDEAWWNDYKFEGMIEFMGPDPGRYHFNEDHMFIDMLIDILESRNMWPKWIRSYHQSISSEI